MESEQVVYLVFLTDHNDNSNTVEGVFESRESAINWILQQGAFAADIYGTSELLATNYDWWEVIKRRNSVYAKTGQVISVLARKVKK